MHNPFYGVYVSNAGEIVLGKRRYCKHQAGRSVKNLALEIFGRYRKKESHYSPAIGVRMGRDASV